MEWLAARLRGLIEGRGTSVEAVAEAIGASPNELSAVLSDDQAPSEDLARRLASHFGEDPEEWAFQLAAAPAIEDYRRRFPRAFDGYAGGAAAGSGASWTTRLSRTATSTRAAMSRATSRVAWPTVGEIAAIAAVTGLAAFLRLYRLADIPAGLHHDEALVGLDALTIIEFGWIGPYTRSSIGFPLGPVYLCAQFIDWLGPSIFSVRLGPALLGALTIPLMYLAFRQMVSWRIALSGAFLLAVSDWHIHLSRLAFPVNAWPFMEMIAVGLLFAGIQRRNSFLYAGAGVATAFSWYAYESALLFVAGMAVFLAVRLALGGGFSRLREATLYVSLVAAALLGAWPMIEYAREPENEFWSHTRTVSIRNTAEYREAEWPLEKVEFMAGRAREYAEKLYRTAAPDAADGLGDDPPIDAITAALVAAGAVIAVWRWRQPPYMLTLIMVPVIALGAVVTIEGTYRRTFGLLPFLMFLGGTTLGILWERTDRLPPFRRMAALALLAVLAGIIVYDNVRLYFDTYAESLNARRIIHYSELSALSEQLNTMPDDTFLYFYSIRATRGHHITRYLTGVMDGADRSPQFGMSVALDHPPPVVFAFLDAYIDAFPRVLARYPGGVLKEEDDAHGPLYRTYHLPVSNEGTVPTPRSFETQPLGPDLEAAALAVTDRNLVSPSCVKPERWPLPLTYYRYAPESDTYAVVRREAAAVADGSAVVTLWRAGAGGVQEAGCAATGDLAGPLGEADMAELGLTASGGEVYYVGVNPGGSETGAGAWEQAR